MADPAVRENMRDSLPAGSAYAALVLKEIAVPLPVRIDDMSMGGAGLVVPPDIGPLITVDRVVDLDITTPKAPGVVARLVARVAHVTQREDGAYSVGVQFASPSDVQRLLPAELTSLLNRRRAFRIDPGPNENIVVELKPVKPMPGLKPGKGALLDVSATGAGILIDQETNKTYGLMTAIQVTFKLTGAPEAVIIPASIRSQVLLPKGVRLGLFFEGRGTKDWTKYERLITQYISRRQIEKRKGG